MVLLDFSHLSYRNLHTCIYSARPKKINKKYVTKDYISLYFMQMLYSLRKLENDFSEYRNVVLLYDSRNNWRKEVLAKDYKGQRKQERKESEINFEEFFAYNEEFKTFLTGLGYKTLEVDYVEADDSAYVLSHITNEKSLLVSEDKDWVQHMIDSKVDLYKPVKKEFMCNEQIDKNELRKDRAVHILIGDAVDNIKSVMEELHYSDEFKSFCSSLNLDVSIASEFEELDIYEDIYQKAEENEIPIWKKGRFGPKTARKFVDNPTEYIKKNIKDRKRFYSHIRRNRQLVDIKKLPEKYKQQVIEEFKKEKVIDENCMDFLDKYNLTKAKSFKLNGIDLDAKAYDQFDTFNSLF